MKKYAVIGLAVAALIGFLIWRAQPEQVIKRRSKALIEMADQVSAGTGIFDLTRLEGYLDQELIYQVDAVSDEVGTANLAEVISAYRWMGENVESCDFEIEEFSSVVIEGDEARAKMQVQSLLEMKGVRMMEGIQHVEFGWRKNERGEWRLAEMLWK